MIHVVMGIGDDTHHVGKTYGKTMPFAPTPASPASLTLFGGGANGMGFPTGNSRWVAPKTAGGN